jgi:hypothetical protein
MQRDKTSQDKKNSKSKSPMLPGTSDLGTRTFTGRRNPLNPANRLLACCVALGERKNGHVSVRPADQRSKCGMGT